MKFISHITNDFTIKLLNMLIKPYYWQETVFYKATGKVIIASKRQDIEWCACRKSMAWLLRSEHTTQWFWLLENSNFYSNERSYLRHLQSVICLAGCAKKWISTVLLGLGISSKHIIKRCPIYSTSYSRLEVVSEFRHALTLYLIIYLAHPALHFLEIYSTVILWYCSSHKYQSIQYLVSLVISRYYKIRVSKELKKKSLGGA